MTGAEDTATDVDLAGRRRIHIVAVGGAGMSSIATLLALGGHHVSGSDAVDGPALEGLADLGVEVHVGHDAALVDDSVEAVVVSTAVAGDNAEVVEARRRGIPVMRRRAFLPAIARVQPFVSVSGTHGKTTTASMLAAALRGAGEDPSFLLGAPVPVLGGSAGLGEGRWTVLEADESDGSFLAGPRAAALLTNAEADHLEFWGGWDSLRDGFTRFLAETEGPVVVCADDHMASSIAARATGLGMGATPVGYGADDSATWRMLELRLDQHGSTFGLGCPDGARREVRVRMPGRHNATNAAGALALAGELGADLDGAISGLGEHRGLYRRFERRGEAGGVVVVDDYAHLPTEVRAALAAGANSGWDRLVVVFQPHRFSRTEALWRDFGGVFSDADVLVLTDIYPAGEEPREGITGELLVDAVRDATGSAPTWAPSLPDAANVLEQLLRPGDLLMTVGAGDVRDIGDMVLERRGAQAGTSGGESGSR